MDDEFHLRALKIMEAAIQLPPSRRPDYIRRNCGADRHLLREVCSLLPHFEQTQTYEPGRGPEWFLPGTTTVARVQEDAEVEADADDPIPPFCIDQYRCEEVIGRGGMGIVYRARHATLKQLFAIKLLQKGLLCSENRWRFAFEAELLRRLRHPGIARIFHVHEVRSARGMQPYFVMEYIRGKSLVRYADDAGLNPLQRLELFARVCEPIEYAHRRGIVHRDLKPGNILVDESGQPKILDFGIARIEDFRPIAGDDDRGRFIGTFAYASPEQMAGKNDQLAANSDVYTLGLILHEMLTGRLPQSVDRTWQLDLCRVHLDESAHTVAREKEFRFFLRAILSGALVRSPVERYRSAGELGEAATALVSEFNRPSGWSALRAWLGKLFSDETKANPACGNRPLAAVLRTRIAMSLSADPPRNPSPPATGSENEAGSGESMYAIRDPER